MKTAVKELSNAFDKIKLSDYDRTYQQAISEALFGNYTDPMQMYKEATARPFAVMLDLFDIWEVTRGPKTLAKLSKKTKDLPPKIRRALKRWKELRAENATKNRALQTKIDRGIAEGVVDPTPMQRIQEFGTEMIDRTRSELDRAANDIRYLLDPPDDFGGAAPATVGGNSLNELLGIMDEAPEPDLTGTQNLIPDAAAQPSPTTYRRGGGGLPTGDETPDGGDIHSELDNQVIAQRGRDTMTDMDIAEMDLSELTHDAITQMRDDAQSLGNTDDVAVLDAELQRRGVAIPEQDTTTTASNFLDNVNSEMLNDYHSREQLANTHGFMNSLAEMVSQDVARFYEDENVDAAAVRDVLDANNFAVLRSLWEDVEEFIYEPGEITASHISDGLLDGFRESFTEESILSGEFQGRSAGSAGVVDMGEGTNRPSNVYRDIEGRRQQAPAEEPAPADPMRTRTGGGQNLQDLQNLTDDEIENMIGMAESTGNDSLYDALNTEAFRRIDQRLSSQNQSMEFLARQDPNQIDLADLSNEQIGELLAIADRDGNQALSDVLDAGIERRMAQHERNAGRQQGGRSSADPSALEFEDTQRIETDLALSDDEFDSVSAYTREELESELARRQQGGTQRARRSRPARPDVLTGDRGERSRSGFDTAHGADAARRGQTQMNTFDNTETYPTPDSIVEEIDKLHRELNDFIPDTSRKLALEEKLAQATEALRRRIPSRGGTRLNMGIDPTQLGEAARGLWDNLKNYLHQTHLRSRVGQADVDMPTRAQDATRILQQNTEILHAYPGVLTRMPIDNSDAQIRVRHDITRRIVPILRNQRELRQLYPDERPIETDSISSELQEFSTEALQDIADVAIELLDNWARQDPRHYADTYKKLNALLDYHNIERTVFDVPETRIEMSDSDAWKTQTTEMIEKIQSLDNAINIRLKDMQPSRRLEQLHPKGHQADLPDLPDPQPLTELTPELINELSSEGDIFFRITDENDTIFDRITADFEQTRLFRNKRIRRVLPGSFRDTTSGKVYREGIYVTDSLEMLADYIETFPHAQNTRLYILRGEHLPASVQAPFFNETILRPTEVAAAFDLAGTDRAGILDQLRAIPADERSITQRIERKVKQLRIYVENMNRLRAQDGSHISEYGTNEIDTPVANQLDAIAKSISTGTRELTSEAAAALSKHLDEAFSQLQDLDPGSGTDPLAAIDNIFKGLRDQIEQAQNPFGYTRIPRKPTSGLRAGIRSFPGHFAETESLSQAFERAIETWQTTTKELAATRDIVGAEKYRPTPGKIKSTLKIKEKQLYDLTAAWSESTVNLIREAFKAANTTPTTRQTGRLYETLFKSTGGTNTATIIKAIKELRYFKAAIPDLEKALALVTDATGDIPFNIGRETMAFPRTSQLLKQFASETIIEGDATRYTPPPKKQIGGISKELERNASEHQTVSPELETEIREKAKDTIETMSSTDTVTNHPVYQKIKELFKLQDELDIRFIGESRFYVDGKDYRFLFSTDAKEVQSALSILKHNILKHYRMEERTGIGDGITEDLSRITEQIESTDPRISLTEATDFINIIEQDTAYKAWRVYSKDIDGKANLHDFLKFWHGLYRKFDGPKTTRIHFDDDMLRLSEAIHADFAEHTETLQPNTFINQTLKELQQTLATTHYHLSRDFFMQFSQSLEDLAEKPPSGRGTPVIDFLIESEDLGLIEELWTTLFEPQRMHGKSRVGIKKGKMSQAEMQTALRSKDPTDWPPELQLAVVRGYMVKMIIKKRFLNIPITNRKSAKRWAKNPNRFSDYLEQEIGD